MWTLTSITVVFLVVSAGVAALARSTTARWERERRGARLARRRPPAGMRRHGRGPAVPRRTRQFAVRIAHGRRSHRSTPVSDEHNGPGSRPSPR
jgi:hypothetical protein